MPFLGKRFCRSLSLSLSISGSTSADRRAMIVGRAKTSQTNQEWKTLLPLGPYYGKDWFIKREGKGVFDPVINRTPAQAAAAGLMPKATQAGNVCGSADEGRNGREHHHGVGSIRSVRHQ
jgi:hypothetical protein